MAQPSWDGTLNDWLSYLGAESLQELMANLTALEVRHRIPRGRLAVTLGTVLAYGADGAGTLHKLPVFTDGTFGTDALQIGGRDFVNSVSRALQVDTRGRIELGGGLEDGPLSAFHRPAVATAASAQFVAAGGKRNILEEGLVVLTAVNVQAAILVQLFDNAVEVLGFQMVAAAGTMKEVRIPRYVGALGTSLVLSFAAAPAAGNFSAVYLSGRVVTP